MLGLDQIVLSIVLPVAKGEQLWLALLSQLHALAAQHFWIMSVVDSNDPKVQQERALALQTYPNLRIVSGSAGRAEQINRAIAEAPSEWIWILHADTELSPLAVEKLLISLKMYPKSLHYFDLSFTHPRPLLIGLNLLGVRFRSLCLQMPFGDQGFALHRNLIREIGYFPLGLAYGEDHVFVWQLRQAGISLVRVPALLLTSPRKYLEQGWLKTTLLHLRLTFLQAAPEWRKLWRLRRQRASNIGARNL